MAEQAETSAAGPAPSGGGGSKLVMIVALVNLIATLGVIAVLFLAFQKEKAKPTVEDMVLDDKGHGAAASGGGEAKKDDHGAGGKDSKAAPAVSDAGKIMALEPFTVNLSSGLGTSPRYVRMNVSVELEPGVPDAEFNIKLPRVRDTVINLLNSKKATELNAPEGREQLKDDIRRAVNSFMLQSKIKGVYFTNFAISN
ncbi:MAG TPA: flagellar basal body-associated FliL family protein [Oligoflexia bacterium]|nr:flagellar basal body-associated FliL family protein [Oligoflexia bacterium]